MQKFTPLYMNLKDIQRKLIESILFKIRLISIMLISFFAVTYTASVGIAEELCGQGFLFTRSIV